MEDCNIHKVFQLLGVPIEIAKTYSKLGIHSLYPWQIECLNTTAVLRGNNLVYCAPTSGGKTFVAELVLLKTVICLQKKVLFILPYVSLVIDKEKHLQKVISYYNQSQDSFHKIRIKAYYGDKHLSKSYQENIIICTIEKANMIFNTLILRQRASLLGAVILDETHVLGNKMNGYLLEILITKMKLYESQQNLHGNNNNNNNTSTLEEKNGKGGGGGLGIGGNCKIQIVALSATMGNVSELANWLNAKLFVTNYRPIPLLERIKAGDELYATDGVLIESLPPNELSKEDPDGLCSLCNEGLLKGQQIVVFCPTKQQCAETAKLLLKLLPPIFHEAKSNQRDMIHEKRQKLGESLYQVPNELQSATVENLGKKDVPFLYDCLLGGVAYHHSSLTSDERRSVEDAFRCGIISILCATTTLAAGVNLPAGRVIIRSLSLGKDTLTVTNYKQMSGRAGRKGQTEYGESFLLVKPAQLPQALDLVQQVMPNIISQIHPSNDGGNAFVKAIIDLIGLEICTSKEDVIQFVSQSLLYEQAITAPSTQEEYLQLTTNCLQFILDVKIAATKQSTSLPSLSNTTRIQTTKFGKALLRSGLDPDEAIIFYESLLQAQERLFLDTPLHLLYLISPYDHHLLPNYKKIFFYYEKSTKLKTIYANFLDLIGLNYSILHKWQLAPPTKYEIDLSSQITRLRGIRSSLGSFATNQITNHQISEQKKPWNLIVSSKRIWTAMLLQSILDGYPMDQILKEYQCELQRQEVENIQRNSLMIASKLERFCKEMGWTGLMKIIHHMKEQLETMTSSIPKECKKLFVIPNLPRRVAKILVDNKITTPDELITCSIEEIVQYLQLSIGFELQEIDPAELGFQPELLIEDERKEQDAKEASVLSVKKSRDELLREKFTFMVTKIFQSAKEFVDSKKIKKKPTKFPNAQQAQVDSESIVNVSNERTNALKETVQRKLPFEAVTVNLKASYNAEVVDLTEANLLDGDASETDILSKKSDDGSESEMANEEEEEDDDDDDVDTLTNSDIDDEDPFPDESTLSVDEDDKDSIDDYFPMNIDNDFQIPVTTVTNPQHQSSPPILSSKQGNVVLDSWPVAKNALPPQFTSPTKTHFVHRIKITPYKQPAVNKAESNDTSEVLVSDDELLRMMEDFENNGMIAHLPGDVALLENNESKSITSADILDTLLTTSLATGGSSFVYFPMENPTSDFSDNFTAQPNPIDLQAKLVEIIPNTVELDSQQELLGVTQSVITGSVLETNTVTTEGADLQRSMADTSLTDDDLIRFMDEWERTQAEQLQQPKLPLTVSDSQLSQSSLVFVSQPSTRSSEDVLAALNTDHLNAFYEVIPTPPTKDIRSATMGVKSTSAAAEPSQANTDKQADLYNEVQEPTAEKRTFVMSPKDQEDCMQSNVQIQTEPTKLRMKKSPYLTPFTASKIATPGKYLYFGLYHHLVSSEQRNSESKDQTPRYPNSSAMVIDEESINVYSTVRVDYSLEGGINASSGMKHEVKHLQTVETCQEFLHYLQTAKYISFELVFRNFPTEFLQYWGENSRNRSDEDATTHLRQKPETILQGWAPLLTQNYYPGLHVTCSHYDINIPSYLNQLSPPCKGLFTATGGGQSSTSMILTSIAFNFGKEESFILRMPQALPVIFSQQSHVTATFGSSLDRLSLPLKEKICAFIGFPNLLFKSLHLYNYLKRGNKEGISNWTLQGASDWHYRSNPLFLVSKHWCYVARKALVSQWRKGGCFEWKLLQEIMNLGESHHHYQTPPTLIAANLKLKLQYLRDRDILLSRHVMMEDPVIAKEILLNSGPVSKVPASESLARLATTNTASKGKKAHKEVPYPVNLFPKYLRTEIVQQHDHQYQREKVRSVQAKVIPVMFQKPFSSLHSEQYPFYYSRGCSIAGYLASYHYSCMKILRQELESSSQYMLYQTIEMPLISLLSDSEYHGIEVEGKELQIIRQQWQQRKTWIGSFFQQLFHTSTFNLDATEDVKKIKNILQTTYQRLSSSLTMDRHALSQTKPLKESSLHPHNSNKMTHYYGADPSRRDEGLTKGGSDWSAGKRKRSVLEDSSYLTSFNSQQSQKSSSSSSLLNGNHQSSNHSHLLSAEKFLEQHPLYCLVSEYRSLVRTLPMIHSILRYRRFFRVRGDYHSIGTETGRMIVSNPPLQQMPKENRVMSLYHPTLAEEILKMSNYKPSVPFPEIRERLQAVIQSINQNILKSKVKGHYEWIKIIPIQPQDSNINDWNFHSPQLLTGKLLFVFPSSVEDHYYLNIGKQHASNPTTIAQCCQWSERSLLFDWEQQGCYFHNLALSNPNFPSTRYVFQVLVELVYHPVAPTANPHSAVEYLVMPASHIYRLQSQPLPSLYEQELLQKSIASVSNNPNAIFTSQDYQELIENYQSLYQKVELRKTLIASPGYVLLTADYCQIELRLLTHFCEDESLLSAFHPSTNPSLETTTTTSTTVATTEMTSYDIFERLASIYKRKALSQVTKSDRTEIKQLCYAVIYGAGPNLIAEQMNLSNYQAQQLIHDFHQRFPTISKFITELYEHSAQSGYVETLFGRKRHLSFEKIGNSLPTERDSNHMRDEESENQDHYFEKKAADATHKVEIDWKLQSRLQRQVINTLCQGSAADLVKLAMVNIHYKLQELSLNSLCHSSFHYRTHRSHPGSGLYRPFDDCRLLLQIHDELVYEVKPEHLPQVAKVMKECMENAVLLKVPLQVKLKTGQNWNDLIEYILPVDEDLEISRHHPSSVYEEHTREHVVVPAVIVQENIVKNLFGNE